MDKVIEKRNKKLNALVVEGGAMRGIFSAGVLDAFLKNNFNPFDICIGVSAGSTNAAAYLGEMYKRNYKVYTDYSIRPDFINFRKFVRGGHLIDLDWLWDITIKELRLDMEKITNCKTEFVVGLTEVSTGQAVFVKPNKDNLEEVIKASSSIPIFYRNFVNLNGVDYVDGGLSDSVPVIEAYKRAAKNIMVIRSRPKTYSMKPSHKHLFSRLYLNKYPELLKVIKNRPSVYQNSIEFLRNPPSGVNIIEVNPPETFKTSRLTKDINILEEDYTSGFNIGIEMIKEWNNITKE